MYVYTHYMYFRKKSERECVYIFSIPFSNVYVCVYIYTHIYIVFQIFLL